MVHNVKLTSIKIDELKKKTNKQTKKKQKQQQNQ